LLALEAVIAVMNRVHAFVPNILLNTLEHIGHLSTRYCLVFTGVLLKNNSFVTLS
jgi:hypothetical protein